MLALFYILYIAATPCLYNFLWKAIQPGEMLGKWQKVLDWIWNYSKQLEKFLGGCEICFSHFISWLGLACFVCFTWNHISLSWYQWIILGWMSISLTWYLGLYSKQLLDIGAAKRDKLNKENEL
jgi:hypothetical protein